MMVPSIIHIMTLDIFDPRVLLLLFGAGIVVRSLSAIKKWKDLGWWAVSWFLAVVIVARIYRHGHATSEQLLLSIFLAFAFWVTLFLYKNVLPKIREHALLFLTLLFLYCFVRYILPLGSGMIFVFLLTLLPCSLVVYFAFVSRKLPTADKLFSYVWFILLNIFFILFYLFSHEISLWDYAKLRFASPYDAFLIGFTVYTLMESLCFLYLFVAVQSSKHDSYEERQRKLKEYVDLLVSRHDDSQLHAHHAVIILVLAGGGLVANYFFHFVSDGILIPSYLFISQFFLPAPKQA